MSEGQKRTEVIGSPLPRKFRRLLEKGKLMLPNATNHTKTLSPQGEPKTKVIWTAILTAILTTIASQIVIDILSLNEPNLVYIGSRPAQPILEVKFGNRQLHELDTLDITISQPFRNWGFRRGHIEKVMVTTGGVNDLMPDSVSEPECDKSAIWTFESRDVKCRFIVTANFEKEYPKDFIFWSTFYGPGGHEVYKQKYVIARSKYGFRDRPAKAQK